ncbi:MAG: hypothetical protein M3R05_00405 [Chloroflexota bacterium]|nr:hypothetical protein [Chloroflexota bacterium]
MPTGAARRGSIALAIAILISAVLPGSVSAATLPPIVPDGDGSRDAAILVRGTTIAWDAINETIAAADTATYLQNKQRVSGRYHAQLRSMPADFTSMSTLSITIRARTTGVSNDRTTLFAQLVAADEVTPLSAEVAVATNPGRSAWTTSPAVAFGGLVASSKATWDGARLRLRWAYEAVGSRDSTQLRLTAVELSGTYATGSPPPDTDPPGLTGASVKSAALTLAYDELLDASSVPASGTYTVLVNRIGRTVSTVGIAGSAVTLTLVSPVVSTDPVTVSYGVPVTNPVQDAAGNDAPAISGQIVTNATPPPGGGINASGNEINDAMRAAGLHGDGRLPDSSYGIWEAATNLDPNGGFEDGSAGGWVATGGTVNGSTDQAKFGSRSSLATASAPGDSVSKSVGGLTALTTYSRSLWIHRTETAAVLTVSVLNRLATGTLASAQVPSVLGWSRVALAPRTETSQTSLTTRIASDTGGVTWYVDGAQLERNVVATPYVETSGATASRGPSKVSVVGTPVAPTQGWVATRIRLGFASSTPFAPDPGILDMSVSNSDALFCYWDVASRTFHLERHRSGSGTTAASAAQTFASGTVKTVIFAWTATEVRVSVDGGTFTSTANTTIPGQATLYVGSDQVQGNGSNRQADSDYLWVAGGSGTLSNADAATIHGFGDTDHGQGDFPGSATFAWPAN